FVIPDAGLVRVSYNGVDWEEQILAEDPVRLNAVAYREGRFTVVGDAGRIYQSDSLQWSYAAWADRVLSQLEEPMREIDRGAGGDGRLNGVAYALVPDEVDQNPRVAIDLREDGSPGVSFTPRDGTTDTSIQVEV